MTVNVLPCVPSGKIVVVIPDPPGQENSRLSSLISLPIPIMPVIGSEVVIVDRPVTLSYLNCVIVNV